VVGSDQRDAALAAFVVDSDRVAGHAGGLRSAARVVRIRSTMTRPSRTDWPTPRQRGQSRTPRRSIGLRLPSPLHFRQRFSGH